MTTSKLIKEVAKSDVPDLSPSLTSLEQLVSALALAGTSKMQYCCRLLY
jgi:hypothetical protein